ncbi:hypothetical protein GF345_06455 [Candidatus Woesearchaeota archaeon]|nr:hypothetical protein [Candidatus Woesearchaeota archaeon]
MVKKSLMRNGIILLFAIIILMYSVIFIIASEEEPTIENYCSDYANDEGSTDMETCLTSLSSEQYAALGPEEWGKISPEMMAEVPYESLTPETWQNIPSDMLQHVPKDELDKAIQQGYLSAEQVSSLTKDQWIGNLECTDNFCPDLNSYPAAREAFQEDYGVGLNDCHGEITVKGGYIYQDGRKLDIELDDLDTGITGIDFTLESVEGGGWSISRTEKHQLGQERVPYGGSGDELLFDSQLPQKEGNMPTSILIGSDGLINLGYDTGFMSGKGKSPEIWNRQMDYLLVDPSSDYSKYSVLDDAVVIDDAGDVHIFGFSSDTMDFIDDGLEIKATGDEDVNVYLLNTENEYTEFSEYELRGYVVSSGETRTLDSLVKSTTSVASITAPADEGPGEAAGGGTSSWSEETINAADKLIDAAEDNDIGLDDDGKDNVYSCAGSCIETIGGTSVSYKDCMDVCLSEFSLEYLVNYI